MNSNKANNKIIELNEALKLKSREEQLRFETTIIHLNLMHQIQKLLDRNKMSHSDFAKYLDVSEAYVSKLFSADKFLNLEKITVIQKLFNVKFNFSFQNLSKIKSNNRKIVRLENGLSPYTAPVYSLAAKSKTA